MTAKTATVWEVYMIRARSGKLYTGITTDIERRFREHAGMAKRRGARFFSISRPDAIVYREKRKNRSEAARRESEIKRMTRGQKLELIEKKPFSARPGIKPG